MGFGADISREFIEVPDSAKGQLLFKWPDHQIRRWSKAIVDIDEMALFVTQGRVVGTLPPGRHTIDASELPFLGDLIDSHHIFDTLVDSTEQRLASLPREAVA